MKILLLLSTIILAQSPYPADSVFLSNNTSLVEKIFISPISLWQRLSFNTTLLDCQFYPSCSEYAAMSISEYGVIKGLPMTADRIVRCNPSAFYYHRKIDGKFHEQDFRLIDLPTINETVSSTKLPILAGLMSAIIPGSGRVYAGRWFDGLMGFIMVFLTAQSALEITPQESTIKKSITYSMAVLFYSGEIYGAYRTAKYYQQP